MLIAFFLFHSFSLFSGSNLILSISATSFVYINILHYKDDETLSIVNVVWIDEQPTLTLTKVGSIVTKITFSRICFCSMYIRTKTFWNYVDDISLSLLLPIFTTCFDFMYFTVEESRFGMNGPVRPEPTTASRKTALTLCFT